MSLPKKQHVGIDEWKMTQIKNLYRSGFSEAEIAEQVDLDISIVKEAIRLLKGKIH